MNCLTNDLNNIKAVINNFLFPFELECDFAEDFGYYPIHNLISISLITIDRSSKNFLSFVNKEFKEVKADIFLWSLLHEIGHHETWDLLTDNELELSAALKEAITNNENITDNGRDLIYFYTPDEYAATEWAANYMIENSQEIKEFWEKLQPLILDIYNKYNIERDEK